MQQIALFFSPQAIAIFTSAWKDLPACGAPIESECWIQGFRMRFVTPLYRAGTVISATRAASKASRARISLNAAESKQLGRLILKGKAGYRSVFDEALSKHGVITQWDDGECTVKLAPGVVIDFPRFAIFWKSNCRIICRPSFAICLNKAHSKIWMRYILKDSTSGNYQSIAGFFEFVTAINNDIVRVCLEKYGSDFSKYFEGPVKMHDIYKLHFISGDVYDAKNLIVSPPEKVFDSICSLDSRMVNIFGPAREVAGSVPAQYINYNTEVGERAVFASQFSKQEVVLRGVYLYETEPWDKVPSPELAKDPYYQQSGAIEITAAMCNMAVQDL
jgi:hypothetical protein